MPSAEGYSSVELEAGGREEGSTHCRFFCVCGVEEELERGA